MLRTQVAPEAFATDGHASSSFDDQEANLAPETLSSCSKKASKVTCKGISDEFVKKPTDGVRDRAAGANAVLSEGPNAGAGACRADWVS